MEGGQEQVDKPSRCLFFGDKSGKHSVYFLEGHRAALIEVASVILSHAGFAFSPSYFPHSFIPASWNYLPINHSHSRSGTWHYFQENQTSKSASAWTFKKEI